MHTIVKYPKADFILGHPVEHIDLGVGTPALCANSLFTAVLVQILDCKTLLDRPRNQEKENAPPSSFMVLHQLNKV